MRILVLGGTGAVGIRIVQETLAASHTVVVYARSPQKLPENIAKHANIIIVKGQLEDAVALDRALDGVHAVVSALGPTGPMHPSGTPLAKAYILLIDLMKKRNIHRIIALGTASNKDPNDKFDLQFWVLVNGVAAFAHTAYKDIVAIGDAIRGHEELAWTLVRVPILTNTEKNSYVVGYVGDGKSKAWLPRSAFASFIVQELELNEWTRKAPLLSAP